MKSENIMDHFNSIDTHSKDKHLKVITPNESDERGSSILERFNKAYGSNESKKILLNEAAPLDTSSSMSGMFNNIKSEKNSFKMDTLNVHTSDAKVTTTSSNSILDKFYSTYGNSLNNNSQSVQNNHQSAQNNHQSVKSEDNFTNKFHSEVPRKDHESLPFQKRNLDDGHNHLNLFSQKDLNDKVAKNFEKSHLNQEKGSKAQSPIDEKKIKKDEQGNNPFKETNQKKISLSSDKTLTSGNQNEFNFVDKFKSLNEVHNSNPKFHSHDVNNAVNHVSTKESLNENKAKSFEKSSLTKNKETRHHPSIEIQKAKSNEHLDFKEKDGSVKKKNSQFPTDDMAQLKKQENKKDDPIEKQKRKSNESLSIKEKNDSDVKKHSSKPPDDDVKDFKNTEKQKSKSNENLSFKEKDSVNKKHSTFQSPFDEIKHSKTKENKSNDLIDKQKSKSNESLNFNEKFSNNKFEQNDGHSRKSMEKLDQTLKEHTVNNSRAHQGGTIFETIETPGRSVKTKASLSKSQSFNKSNKNIVDKENIESTEKVNRELSFDNFTHDRSTKKIGSPKRSSVSQKSFPEDDSSHMKENFFRNTGKEAGSPSNNIKGNLSKQSILDKEVDLKSKKLQRQSNFESKKNELLHQSNFPNEDELTKPKMKMKKEETDLIIKKKNADDQNEVEEIFVSQSKKTFESKSQHLQRDELVKKQKMERADKSQSSSKLLPLKATLPIKDATKITLVNSAGDDALKKQRPKSAQTPKKSLSFTNISNIKPLSPTPTCSEQLNSVLLREQVYYEWLQRKHSFTKEIQKEKCKITQKEEDEKRAKEEERKLLARKSFEAWTETKSEQLKKKTLKKKEKENKDKELEEEKLQKTKDSKKAFDNWKENKDDRIMKESKKKQQEEAKKKKEELEQSLEKASDAKKVFENWKQQKDELLKKKIKEQKEASKKESEAELEKMEKKQQSQRAFENWKEKRVKSPRPCSPALTQRAWCPGGRNQKDSIPASIQPVILRNVPPSVRMRTLSST